MLNHGPFLKFVKYIKMEDVIRIFVGDLITNVYGLDFGLVLVNICLT